MAVGRLHPLGEVLALLDDLLGLLDERVGVDVGADIEAVCREAATVAVREHVRSKAAGESANVTDITVTMGHFEQALDEVDAGVGDEDQEFDHPAAPMGTGRG